MTRLTFITLGDVIEESFRGLYNNLGKREFSNLNGSLFLEAVWSLYFAQNYSTQRNLKLWSVTNTQLRAEDYIWVIIWNLREIMDILLTSLLPSEGFKLSIDDWWILQGICQIKLVNEYMFSCWICNLRKKWSLAEWDSANAFRIVCKDQTYEQSITSITKSPVILALWQLFWTMNLSPEKTWQLFCFFWFQLSTHWNNMSQNWIISPQVGVKIKQNIWNRHLHTPMIISKTKWPKSPPFITHWPKPWK